jgi:hypothetical protein
MSERATEKKPAAKKAPKKKAAKSSAKAPSHAPPAAKPARSKAASTALVVASPAPAAAHAKPDRALLAEALRRAESARNVMESQLLDFGRWLLVEVFEDDAGSALGDRKRDNPVWRELLARAGGPTLRVSERFLYVSLEIAAHDKRIQDDSWRLLEPGRKELLLPLRDESLMRKAARRVVEMKLSQRATKELVRAELAARDEKPTSRVTPQRFHTQIRRFRERVLDTSYHRKIESQLRELPKQDKTAVRDELQALQQWATSLLAALR